MSEIKLPVRYEWGQLIDAEGNIFRIRGGENKVTMLDPIGRQIADALNDQAKLASAVEVIRHYADKKNWDLNTSMPIDKSTRWSLDIPFNEYAPDGDGYDKAAEWLKEHGEKV